MYLKRLFCYKLIFKLINFIIRIQSFCLKKNYVFKPLILYADDIFATRAKAQYSFWYIL